MSTRERLGGTLQECLITLLTHSDEHGKIVANMIDPSLFEGDYRVVAERAIDFWRVNGRAPGVHAPDMLSNILEDPKDRRARTFRALLSSMLHMYETINAEYVLSELRTFVKLQRFKDAVQRSAERLSSNQELALSEVEELWADLLKSRDEVMDPGMTLQDVDRLVDYLKTSKSDFVTGIDQLDRGGVVPARGTVFLILAPTGFGKSWGLIHLGKHALLQRKRILHISLEMSEDQVTQRYYQSLLAVPKRETGPVELSSFIKNTETGRLEGIDSYEVTPQFSLDSDSIREELNAHSRLFRGRVELLLIKRFPTRSLTIKQLAGYLDYLESSQGFIPDMLALDYIGIMKTDASDHRISLGRTFEEFRGLCVERNIAGVTAHQISREGAAARTASTLYVAEDWSLVGSADIAVTISATRAEHRLGLARIGVDKVRDEEDKFTVLVTQNYKTGQFVIQSIQLNEKYFDILKDINDEDEDGEGGKG